MTDENRPLVIVFGVIPPPVTGMSLCTERVANFLEGSCQVRRFNLSDGSGRVTLGFRIRKIRRVLAALATMALSPKLRGAVLYMPANYRGAVYYNLAAALVARLRGWRVALHHHVYFHLHRYDWRMKLLDRLLPPGSAHLALCCEMSQRMLEFYGFRTERRLLPSTILLTGDSMESPPAAATTAPTTARRLGHLSNLSVAKGTVDALQVFARLREAGHDVELVIAGPVMDSTVQRELDAVRQQYGKRVDYRGPVYGADKWRFFQDIDVMLFPSRMEAQPIVISEAFAFGCPVIAKALSCIPSLIGEASWTVDPQADFVGFATALIERWLAAPDEFRKASDLARRRTPLLREEAVKMLEDFAGWIRRGAEAGPSVPVSSPARTLIEAPG